MKDNYFFKPFVITAVAFSLPIVAFVTAVHAIDYHKDATDGVRCDWCHDFHGGFPAGLLQDVDAETVCLSCHEPGVNADAPDATTHASATCVDCHDTHSNRTNYLDTTNTSLVGISYDSNGNAQGDYVATVMNIDKDSATYGTYYNVDFEDPIRKFIRTGDRDAVAGARRICQVCHIAPPAKHPPQTETSDCTRCHPHANGFMKSTPKP